MEVQCGQQSQDSGRRTTGLAGAAAWVCVHGPAWRRGSWSPLWIRPTRMGSFLSLMLLLVLFCLHLLPPWPPRLTNSTYSTFSLACCGHGRAYSCPTAHRQLISEFHSRDRESPSILQTILKTNNWITIKWTHLRLKIPLSFKIGSYKKCWSPGLRPMCRKEFLITQSFLWKTFWLNNKLCILPIFI